ncbi:hypothetical protein E5170_18070 [Pseudomonas atacamensis]|uniref:Uncharacterized protein n=1 Tax=Pseudomonas atacamensis TaxID=2565368 RepID=A0AAQ2D8R4_9PSED|nr:hypothetical protein [Pseudomonas atacamensis]THF29113.1 hypothetical protein E5170_18070 [Pseudomonas atacamensis]
MLVTKQPVLRRFWYALLPMTALDAGPQPFTLLGEALVVGGGRPTLRALLVGGRLTVHDDQLPDFDLAELGAQARDAVRRLQQAAGVRS